MQRRPPPSGRLCPLQAGPLNASLLNLQVQRDVDLLCLRLPQPCGLRELAAGLSARGHKVAICKSAGGGSGVAAFRKLRHAYISIAPPMPVHEEVEEQQQQQEDELELEDGELLVDPHFACQVRCQACLAHTSARPAPQRHLQGSRDIDCANQ